MSFIKGIWSALAALFTGQSTSSANGATKLFRMLDIQGIARELRLRESGKEMGGRNLPGSQVSSLDSAHRAVIHFMESELASQQEEAAAQLDACRTSITRFTFITEAARLQQTCADGQAKYQSLKATIQTTLASACEDLRNAQMSHVQFRELHCLNRPSEHPESTIFLTGVLAVVAMIELLMNTSFFAAGNREGLIGGFGYALGLVFINVGVSWTAGRLSTYVNHKNVGLRLAAAAMVIMYFAFLFAVNLAAAHYRDLMAAENVLLVSPDFMNKVLSAPFDLSDFISWVLLFVGIAFGLIAFTDGVFWDDRYPGYGRVARRLQESRQDFIEEVHDLNDEVTGVWETASHRISNHLGKAAIAADSFRLLVQQVLSIISGVRNHVTYLTNSGQALLTIFREANSAARTTPVPAYFNEEWTFDGEKLAGVNMMLGKYQPLLAASETALNDVQRSLQKAREALAAEYQQVLGEIKRASDSCGAAI